MNGAPTTPTRLHVVGSGSPSVLAQVSGPRRAARVVHAGASAAYLDLEGACVGVLSAGAVQVPCGIRTPLAELPVLGVGAEVTVEDQRVLLPGCEIRVAGIVDTMLPGLSSEDAGWAAARLRGLVAERVSTARDRLPATALAALAAADATGVLELLGLGPGLTPLGDDVLSGWLATAVSRRHPGLAEVRRAVALHATARTTMLSAALLACAARGEAVPELRSLMDGVVSRSPEVVEQSLQLLLHIGHESGQGLVLGTLLALAGTDLGAAA